MNLRGYRGDNAAVYRGGISPIPPTAHSRTNSRGHPPSGAAHLPEERREEAPHRSLRNPAA